MDVGARRLALDLAPRLVERAARAILDVHAALVDQDVGLLTRVELRVKQEEGRMSQESNYVTSCNGASVQRLCFQRDDGNDGARGRGARTSIGKLGVLAPRARELMAAVIICYKSLTQWSGRPMEEVTRAKRAGGELLGETAAQHREAPRSPSIARTSP